MFPTNDHPGRRFRGLARRGVPAAHALLLVALCLPALHAYPQGAPPIPPPEVLQPQRLPVDHGIRIDGRLDEPVWSLIPVFDDFVLLEPDTLARGPHPTLLRFAYDDRALYLAAEMVQPPETLIRRLSGRDERALTRDSINLTLDPSGEGLYGYWFGVNLGDSLMDGTALPERRFSNEWDGHWRGASAETATGWTAEMIIPWNMMSMPTLADAKAAARRIGVYLSRKVAYLDERWGWPALPASQPKFMSALYPLEVTGVAPTQQYSVYPFTAVTRDEIDDEVTYKVGADVFWRPATSFQLNATINPDFGSVESDDVVINLTAVETFFPEKRLFFLEGQDVFIATPRADTRNRGVGNTGLPTTLLFTRRIGGQARAPLLPAGVTIPDRELIQPVELHGAAKVTGQLGNLRYGVLGAFEKDVKLHARMGDTPVNIEQDGSDYGIVRVSWEETLPSGAQRAFGFLSTATLHPDADAYTHGIDFHYLTPGGGFELDGQVYASDLDAAETGYGGFVDFVFIPRRGFRQRVGIEYVDEHADLNDLGFLERNDRLRVRTAFTHISSDLAWARDNEFDVRGFLQVNNDELFTGGGIFFSNRAVFRNLMSLTARVNWQPSYYDDLNSFGNGAYRIDARPDASLEWASDPTRRLQGSLLVGRGTENLGGGRNTYRLELRWQPSDNASINAKIEYLDRSGWLLHQGGADFTTFDAEQWLPSLGVEYFVNARHQIKVSAQWVGVKARERAFYRVPGRPSDLIRVAKPPGPPDDFAISDMVFQVRYRWEIAPLSDLFVVYRRGSAITRGLGDAEFSDLLDQAWDQPIGNQFVVKLRYRFGS